MPRARRRGRAVCAAFLLVLAVILAGCPGGTPTQPVATPEVAQAPIAQQAADAPSSSEVATIPPTPTESPTAAPTKLPPTLTPTAAPPTPTAAPPTDMPTREPTATPTQLAEPQASKPANLRAGPGTEYAIVGAVAAQAPIKPIGRDQAGDWYMVQTAAGEAWIAAFLVKNVTPSDLPVRESAAPTVTPKSPLPAATAAPIAQASGAVPCGGIVAAPMELQVNDKPIEVVAIDTQFGKRYYTKMAKQLSWRWNGLDQVRDMDWYFDVQVTLGGEAGNPLLRTYAINPDQATNTDGLWTALPPGTTKGGNAIAPEFFTSTCPPSEPRCPLHVRLQVAVRDSTGKFVCFVSAPSNSVPLPLP